MELGVGRVLAVVDAGGVADGDGVRAGEGEDGANEAQGWHAREGGGRQHAPHAAHAAAAHDVVEHSLDVVVGGVAGGDGARALALGGKGEELVAQSAGRLLDPHPHLPGGEGNVALAGHAGHLEAFAQVGHEFAVTARLVPQVVIEVGGDDLETLRFAQVAQEEEGGDGVGATADGHDDLLDAAEELLALGEAPDALKGRGGVVGHYLGKRRSHHSPERSWSEGGGGLSTTNAVSPARM